MQTVSNWTTHFEQRTLHNKKCCNHATFVATYSDRTYFSTWLKNAIYAAEIRDSVQILDISSCSEVQKGECAYPSVFLSVGLSLWHIICLLLHSVPVHVWFLPVCACESSLCTHRCQCACTHICQCASWNEIWFTHVSFPAFSPQRITLWFLSVKINRSPTYNSTVLKILWRNRSHLYHWNIQDGPGAPESYLTPSALVLKAHRNQLTWKILNGTMQ